MMDPFQIAAERARSSVTRDHWNGLDFHEQSNAIYRELRSLDREMAAERLGQMARKRERKAAQSVPGYHSRPSDATSFAVCSARLR